jgi:ribosomal protein S18 acetylase RimI-like enzyme
VVVLRDAVARDAAVIARVYVKSWNQGFGHLLGLRELTPELIVRWRDDLTGARADWTVAEADGVVVGFVGVGPSRDPVDPAVGELDTIAVDPGHWRTGIGSALMRHAVGVLQRSWSRAILWTPDSYDRGRAFYRATGWTPLEGTRADGREIAFGRDL